MIKLLRLIGFLIRIICFYSNQLRSITKYFLFPTLIDSQQTIKEDEFLYSHITRPFFSEKYFSVI